MGHSVGMLEGAERVTGRLAYVLDFELPGMLFGRILRSPVAHAGIVRLDAGRAEKLPGVAAVVTRDDFPWHGRGVGRYGRIFRDQTVVAAEKVRFLGEPVAAVAAVNEEVAEEALALLEVDYEELPAVFDEREALRQNAPMVHDPRPDLVPAFAKLVANIADSGNLCSHFKLRRGDVAHGFAQSDFVFEDTFRCPAVQHVPLEPHVTIAQYSGGKLTIWTSTQMPHAIRIQMAELFDLPAAKVRVLTSNLGGGFGSKGSLRLEPITSFLALKAGKPVKITLSREEEFVTVCKHPATISLKTGVKKDGTLCAREVACYFNTGAYTDIGPVVARNAGSAMSGPYRTEHVKIDSYTVWTNLVPAGALRGFGVPQAVWAYESQMDMIAERLGLDPVVVRQRNIVRDGDVYATGEALDDLHYDELLQRAATAIDWRPADAWWLREGAQKPATAAKAWLRRGKGLALVIKATITPSTSTSVLKLNEDGSLNVLTSSVDVGQGAKTVLAQIASDAAQVPLEKVSVSEPDTDHTPYDQQTSSSRTTFSMGGAIVRAAADLKSQLVEIASELLEVSSDDLAVCDGAVTVRGAPGRSLSYGELIIRGQRGNLVGRGTFSTQGGLDLETGQGIGSVHWHQGAIGCEVEVDIESGRVRVIQLSPAVYAGKVINPRLCELQLEGSAFFGLGQALFEEMIYDGSGQVTNRNLSDYMIPSFLDVPERLDVALLERGAAGEVHGIGETLLPPVMAAVGNALYNAVGIRVGDLPLTPEKVLRALAAKR